MRMYGTTKAGELLGGLSGGDVLELIRQKKLRAKKMVVRGKNIKPRKYITDAEIERFIRELPEESFDAPAEVTPDEPRVYSRRPSSVQRELAQVKKYY